MDGCDAAVTTLGGSMVEMVSRSITLAIVTSLRVPVY
jgi:hypothetical protein